MLQSQKTYRQWQTHFELSASDELEAEHETKMYEQFGTAMITEFPEMTSPFWNMSRNDDGDSSKKIDVVWRYGNNRSAERSSQMLTPKCVIHSHYNKWCI